MYDIGIRHCPACIAVMLDLLMCQDDLSCDCIRVFQEVQDMLSEMRAREGAPEGMPSLANLYSSRDYKRSWRMMLGGLMAVATEEE